MKTKRQFKVGDWVTIGYRAPMHVLEPLKRRGDFPNNSYTITQITPCLRYEECRDKYPTCPGYVSLNGDTARCFGYSRIGFALLQSNEPMDLDTILGLRGPK